MNSWESAVPNPNSALPNAYGCTSWKNRVAPLAGGRAVPRRYRNRRIGEFLKELELSEGRGTGISKIVHALLANGSPTPAFETDENRTSLLVRLPLRLNSSHEIEIIESPYVGGVLTPHVERLPEVNSNQMEGKDVSATGEGGSTWGVIWFLAAFCAAIFSS